MADQLKTFFSRALVTRLAGDVAAVHPAFPVRRFIGDATRGLDDLELLDRARLIAAALADHLPRPYPRALDVLLRSLGEEHDADELMGVGMAPFYYLPHVTFVATEGLDHFDLSMQAQYELTKRFTAEFSIRPFIARDPERVFAVLRGWASDANAHVRRLVSEGTRLRLPWGQRVAWLDANPDRVIALLELLRDDPSSMVRRSVANNLNDIGKVRPDLLVGTAAAWLTDATPDRRALVEHALRSAVKRGLPEALRLLGYGGTPKVALQDVEFTPARVSIGGQVRMRFTLCSTSRVRQDLLVDVAVHFVKARGATSRKVFKLRRLELAGGDRAELKTTFSLAIHTTRVPYPGAHAVDVVVNGQPMQAGVFHVRPARTASARRQAR
jgi:3-methyladenine DNA glycosylase AlkC